MAYCAASDVTIYGNFATTDAEALMTLLIARAKAIIDEYCGRTFEEGTAAVRYFTGELDADDDGLLLLDDDLYEMATDTTALVAGSNTIASSNYVLVPRNEKPAWGIRLLDSSPVDWGNPDSDGEIFDAVQVKGKWAYSSVAPADIQHACIRLAYYMYKQRESDADLDRPLLTADGITIMPTQLPADVRTILDRYKKRLVVS